MTPREAVSHSRDYLSTNQQSLHFLKDFEMPLINTTFFPNF